jgi:hypothetical protein
MTRKDFLKTMSAAAVAAIPKAAWGTATTAGNLRRGVSLYCYQEEFYTRAMTLEDCLSEASSIGAYAIEMLPEQMVPDFPNPSDHWVGQWRDWIERYHLVADTYTQFQDTVLIKGQDLSLDEGVSMLERDLKLAKRMGFKNMRLLIGTPVDVIDKAIPLAERYDIWMGCEIHAPAHINSPLVHRWIEIADKHKTSHFGLIPDFGIFQTRPPRVQTERQIRDGVLNEQAVRYIEKAWQSGESKEKVTAEVSRMGGGQADVQYVGMLYGTKMEDPRELIPLKGYIRHFHAKFYEMTEDFHETCIPYEKVIPVLLEGGIDASIVSEYEGQRHTQDIVETDGCEQVRRQHVMLRRLFGEI